MTTADNWTTDDIRRDRSVTQSENRHTDHKLELQVVVNYMNKNPNLTKSDVKEIANIVNDVCNLESRGQIANRKKGQATTSLLRNNFEPTNDTQRKALEKNWEGLKDLQSRIDSSPPEVKKIFSQISNDLKKALKSEGALSGPKKTIKKQKPKSDAWSLATSPQNAFKFDFHSSTTPKLIDVDGFLSTPAMSFQNKQLDKFLSTPTMSFQNNQINKLLSTPTISFQNSQISRAKSHSHNAKVSRAFGRRWSMNVVI